MFCNNCGANIKEGIQFCSSCGTVIKVHQKINSLTTPNQLSPTTTTVGKRNLLRYVLLLLLIGIFVGTYFWGKTFFRPEKVVSEFLQGLTEKDPQLITKHLASDDLRIKISVDSVKPFLDLLEKQPSTYNQVKEELQQQLMKPSEEAHHFTLKKDGKHFYMFDRYVIRPTIHFVNLELFGEDITLSINDKDYGNYKKEQLVEIGPLLPGLYIVEAMQETKYVTLTDEITLTLLENTLTNASLSVSGEYVYLESNEPNAKLFVNGEKTGLTIDDGLSFGPVPTNGSMSLHVELDENGQKYESGPERIGSNNDYIYFYIEKMEEKKVAMTNQQPFYDYSYGFIFPDSHIRYLTKEEVAILTKAELRIARNEIYARNGYIFNSEDLRNYFWQKDWYYENPYYNGVLSLIEKTNVDLIKSYE